MVISAIISNTYKDCVRQPLFFIILIVNISLIGLFPLLSFFVFSEQLKLVLDSSMASILFFSAILSVLLSANTIYKDISTGNISLILSKPISKNTFLAGRIIGVMICATQFIAISFFSAITSIYIAVDQFNLDYRIFYTFYLLIVIGAIFGFLMNYFFRKSFSGSSICGLTVLITAQALWLIAGNSAFLSDNNLPFASLASLAILILLAIWVLVNISTAVSTRFDIMVNLIFTLIIMILGMLSDYMAGKFGADENVIFSVIYTILPNFQLFFLVDAVTAGKHIPAAYMIYVCLYAFLYICALFAITSISFAGVEVSKNLKE